MKPRHLSQYLLIVSVMTALFIFPGSLSAKELFVGLESSPRTMDPRFATDAYGMRISHHLLFSTLVQLGYELKIVPDLAEKWETPNNTTYIFYLRKNVRFHDGHKLTADDVKFTFEHLMDPATKSPFAGTYKGKIKQIEVLDSTTVRFVLNQPTASFLTSIIMPIIPKHIISKGDNFAETLVGSGPFKFTSQSPNEIKISENKEYFGGRPKVEHILFKVVKDDNTRFLKTRKGELDILINAIPNNKVDAFKKSPLNKTYDIIEEPGINYNYLSFNLNNEKVKDKKLRQALAYGIDVDEIITYRKKGHAVRSTGLLSTANWYHSGDVIRYPHDPKKAEALLDSMGLVDPDKEGPKPRLVLELKTSTNAEVVGIARIIQAQLSKIGIRLELKSYEWGTFYGDIIKGNFQLTSMRWVGVTEPDFYYDLFHSTQIPPTGRNRGRYINTELDRVLESGRITLDPVKRKSIYAKVQRIISEDLPYVSLWHDNNIAIIHKRVKGYRQHPMAGFFSFKEVSIH